MKGKKQYGKTLKNNVYDWYGFSLFCRKLVGLKGFRE